MMRSKLFVFGLLLLLTSTSLLGAINLQSSSTPASAIFNESRILINQGKYQEAIKQLESMQKLYPKNSQVFYWLSIAAQRNGDLERAIEYTQSGIKIAPQNSELRFELAKLYSKSQKFDAAEKEFKKLEKNAKSAILRKKVKRQLSLMNGLRMLSEGKNAQALSFFSDLAQIFPRDVVIKETLANIYFSQNLLDEAERTYLQALAIQPNKASILLSLANVFKRYGDTDYAHSYLKQVIELDPTSAAANNAISIAIGDANKAADENQMSKAVEYVNTIVNVIPYHKQANTTLANIYLGQNRYDEAAQALKNILIKYPTDKNTRILISDILAKAGNIDAAIDELQQIITLSPEQNFDLEISTKINLLYGKKARSLGKNLNNEKSISEAIKLAQEWYDNGKYDTSQWLIEAVLKADPNIHDAHLILGRIYAKRSQFRLALQEFATAIKLDYKTVEARVEYAQVMEILGDYQSAEAIYIDIKPLVKSPVVAKRINSSIALVKAEKYRQQGKFNAALQIYEKLEKSNPNNIRTLQHMGNIYLSMGNTPRAEVIFEKLIKAERLLEKQLSLLKQGNSLLNQKNYRQARDKFSEIVSLNPKNAQAHYLIGVTFSEEGKIKDALASVNKSVELDPTNLNLKLKLARLLMKAGDLDRSTRLYDTVYRNTNDKAKRKEIKRLSSFTKGQHLIKQRKYFEAVQHYEAATQIFTQDADMHEALASLYYTQNLNDESLREYSTVLQLAPERFKIHNQMADLYGRLGDTGSQYEHLKIAFLNQTDENSSRMAENKILALAKKEINKKLYSDANLKLVLVLSKNPQNIVASYILADLYKINKKYEKAESVYYQILALKPVDLKTRSLLANLYLESEKSDNAIIEFEKIVSIAPGSNIGKEARSKLNVLLLEKADKLVSEAKSKSDLASILDTAIDWLEKDYYEASQWLLSNISQRQPENAEASYWLGELFLEKGESQPGIEHIFNAAKLDPNNLEYRLRLGQALVENRLYDEAIKHLKSIVKSRKGGDITEKAKREIAHASGRILIDKKQYKKAHQHFKDAQKLYKSGFKLEIAESLILLKRLDDAEKLLTKLTEEDTRNFKAHGLIARIHKEKGDIRKHLQHLDKAWIGIPGEGLKESSISNLGLNAGFSKLKNKTWGDAIIEFNRALNHDPNNLYAILGKHVALTNSGNVKEAEIVMNTLMREKEKTMKAKIKFLEVRSLVSQ